MKKLIQIKKKQYLESIINLTGADQKFMGKYVKETIHVIQINQWMENERNR